MREQTEREFLHAVTNVFSVAHGTVNLLKTLYEKNQGLEKSDHIDEHLRKAIKSLEEVRNLMTERHNRLRHEERRK